MLDLFCGRWGWSRAFAARGWKCIGIDLIEPFEIPNGCDFLHGDILVPGYVEDVIRHYGFDFGCASSPCENFSLFQIRNFHPNPPFPEMGIKLFNRGRELFHNAGIPHVLENVRAAEQFVGKAENHSGSFYLWGDSVPPLIPKGLSKGMKMDRKWCQNLGGHGSKKRDSQTAGFATIPSELANCVADYAERILEEAGSST